MATVNHITDQFLSTNNVVVSALTFSTIISSLSSGNSIQWNQAYDVATTYQSASGSFATKSSIIPTVTNHLSTNNVLISSLNIIDKLTATDIFGAGTEAIFSDTNNQTGFGLGTLTLNFTNGVYIPTSLTVVGNVNGSNLNISNWNSVYTSYQNTSGSFATIPTVTNYLSTNSVVVSAIQSSAYIATSSVIINVTGTSYLLSNSVNGRIITLNNANPITVSVPSGLPVGFNTTLIQIGTGQVSLSAGSGVTINSDGNKLKIATQHSSAELISYASNVFNLAGNLAL